MYVSTCEPMTDIESDVLAFDWHIRPCLQSMTFDVISSGCSSGEFASTCAAPTGELLLSVCCSIMIMQPSHKLLLSQYTDMGRSYWPSSSES